MPSQTPTRLIAVEEHFATDDYFDSLERLSTFEDEAPEHKFMLGFAHNPKMRSQYTDPQQILDTMGRAGVDMSVVSLNPPGAQVFTDADVATELVRSLNDTLTERVRAEPGRIAGLGALAPQDPEAAAEEVGRIMGSLHLGGVLLGSHTHGHYLDEPEFDPLLSALEEHDATLYLHPRSPSPQMLGPFERYGMVGALWGFQAEASTHAMRLILSGTLDRHPKLRIVLGHLGEALPYWLWRLDNIYARTMQWEGEQLGMVKLELAPTEYLARNFWVTTSGMSDPAVLQFAAQRLGADRIMFAIDYPYEDEAGAVQSFADTPLGDEQRALISHQTAERLFRIPPA